ncbi:hypothetical protein D3C87_1425290 [compost metagenome]
MLFQGGDQGVVPTVFTDARAVGRLAGGGDLIVFGAFGAHQGVVQPRQRIAHVVTGGVSGHRQRPSAPSVLVHGHPQRTQFTSHPFGQHAGLRRRGPGHQEREVRAADPGKLRRGSAKFGNQLAQAVR